MKRLQYLYLYSICLLTTFSMQAQKIDASLSQKQWKAFWITVPGAETHGYGVYLFRKEINLSFLPASYEVHVSADNRYKLFVNEKLVSLGPARGDINHWNFETIDIASFLQTGQNIIAAQVWNDGEWRPEGQISLRTGFILEAGLLEGQNVNTNISWKCTQDSSYQPVNLHLPTYYVAGPGEEIQMQRHIKDWTKTNFSDGAWKNAQLISAGMPKNRMGGYGTVSDWMLVPSIIPQMELKPQRLMRLVKSVGISVPAGFPSSKIPITIPAHTVATILLDQNFLTNAYPTLIFSGGREGTVSIGYAEALFTKYPAKGNRNETEGKIFLGRTDSIWSDGSREQIFTSLTWRTYRYIQLRIITKEDPLTLEDISGTTTGYPFEYKAKFGSENPELNQILDIGWRTARLCAMETYMDCPYYEQLQYVGDSKIQALVSLYNSGDERLLLNAMNEMDNSRLPEGLTESRHPSFTPQYIPTFSLWYIGMLHDYMMYGRDSNFVINKLAGERQILHFFRNYQQEDGSVQGVPHWMFTDWVETKDWNSGVGPKGKDGTSSLIDLQLLWAYQSAAEMEMRYGMKSYATLYTQYAEQLKKTVRSKYWDRTRNLFADRSEKDLFSQHANVLAILTGVTEKNEEKSMGGLLLSDTSLAPASIYFKYYLHLALVKAGFGNDYLNWLGLWRDNIKMGLTTWAEISDLNNARSDCHAWGASPNIEFFRTVLGIDSDAPGFAKIKIEPHLGTLKNIRGTIPHPNGQVAAAYSLVKDKWNIEIDLPAGTSGQFIWERKSYSLHAGPNHFNF